MVPSHALEQLESSKHAPRSEHERGSIGPVDLLHSFVLPKLSAYRCTPQHSALAPGRKIKPCLPLPFANLPGRG